jgi:eukaryotic-like serine/threonine-protein kinase
MNPSAPPPASSGSSTTSSPPDPAARTAARWQIGSAGGIELDELTLELRRGGQPVAIEPKPLELLMLLVRQPDVVVTKDELLDQVWAGRVVSESVLTKCVAKLRDALGDETQSLIKTVHGFGYRLTAPVRRLGPAHAAAARAPDAWLQAGAVVPLRPNWRLVSRYDGARGENWLAEQVKTGEKRVFKFARDGAALTAVKREITLHRLLREALDQRPDIVRVLDWNLDEPPYFVELEHCSEGSLAEWARRAGGIAAVPLATRLDIVARTAEALAAAHSVGVLHKDIKPANVLIELDATGSPRVRLCDFGSAQVLDDERLRSLHITRMGLTQSPSDGETTSGTWAYLAPEVISGQPPTVQSDVYALGAMLYQMVVGDLRRPLAPGWEREVDDALLREDIAAASDVDPAKRLADAGELARRLRSLEARHAEIAAARVAASESERLQAALVRAQRRRRWASAVAVAAGVGIAVTGTLLLQVQAARREADRQAAAAAAVNAFLVRDMLAAADPYTNPREIRVRDVLAQASAQATARFSKEPVLEAAVRRSLGEAYVTLSDPKAAAAEFARAAALRPASEERERARDLYNAGANHVDADNLADARPVLDQALALVGTPQDRDGRQLAASVRKSMALAEHGAGRTDVAVAQLQALLPEIESAHGAVSAEMAIALESLGDLQTLLARYPEAEVSLRRALALRESVFGARHPRAIKARARLGATLGQAGRYDDAEVELRRALEASTLHLGPDHRETLATQEELALSLMDAGKLAAALPLFEDSLQRRQKLGGPPDRSLSTLLNNLGLLYRDLKRPRDGLVLLEQSLGIIRDLLGPAHPEVLTTLFNMSLHHQDLQQWSEARRLQEELLRQARSALSKDHWHLGVMLTGYADTLQHLGEHRQSAPVLREALAILEPQLPADHFQVRKARRLLDVAGKDRRQAYAPASPIANSGLPSSASRIRASDASGAVQVSPRQT